MLRIFSVAFIVGSMCGVMKNIEQKEKFGSIINYDVYELVRDNIDLFNAPCEEGEKEETSFEMATSCYNVLSPYTDDLIGTLIVFDNNKGYITISNDNYILDSNYNDGFVLLGDYKQTADIYYLAHTYSFNKSLLFNELTISGGNIADEFHWHADDDWTSEKTRYLQTEYDSQYSTKTNTTQATYNNKTTWSTEQGNNSYCAAYALANLLWTYKINNVVDLTDGIMTSSALASALTYTVPANAAFDDLDDINDTLLDGTGYYIDYCDVTDGTADTLETAPLIVLYILDFNPNDGHYALVTGKGESLYQTIMWMNFYTSWDVTNTWYNRYDYNNNYLKCKRWVDSQHATFGYVLRDSDGDVVPL